MAQAQAKHDASQLYISHATNPLLDRSMSRMSKPSSIWTKRWRRRRRTAKMLKGQLMLHQWIPAPALRRRRRAQARAGPLPRLPNRLWHWAESLSELDCAPGVVEIVHSIDNATCLPATLTLHNILHRCFHCVSSCLSTLCIILP